MIAVITVYWIDNRNHNDSSADLTGMNHGTLVWCDQ